MAGLVIASPSGAPSSWSAGAAFSAELKQIAEWVHNLHRPSPASLRAATAGQQFETHVFDALASVKVMTALAAMHLSRESRDKLFSQLNSLHDAEQWEAGDEPINASSFETFLKAILSIRPERRPGLGLSHTGDLIGAWTTGRDRLTIDFLPKGRVRWVLARYRGEGEPDRFAGQVEVSHLVDALAPYHPEHWFSNETTEQSSR